MNTQDTSKSLQTKALRRAALTSLALLPGLAAALDWSQMESRDVTLFQPGQSAWEWLLVPGEHDGGRRMREGKDCLYCHAGEEPAIGNLIASGEMIEPSPMPGMPGAIELAVQAALEGDNLHLRLSWTSLAGAEPAGDETYQARATVMIADDTLSAARIAGCWAACHGDLPGMPDEMQDAELTKYLPNSRSRMTRTGGGADYKSDAEVAAELERGAFFEYWSVKLDQGTVLKALDGYFLEARREYADSAVSAEARLEDGRWVVEIARPLSPESGPRLALAPRSEYTVAFAVHDNHTDNRFHYTSFPMGLSLTGDGVVLVTKSRTE